LLTFTIDLLTFAGGRQLGVVAQLAPALPHAAFELFPTGLDLMPIHDEPLLKNEFDIPRPLARNDRI
jgi:hypothetical protein